MKTIEKYLIQLINGMMVLCLAVMLILVFTNVVLRYGFNSGITVSEELSRLLFVWMTFLGAIVAMKEHAHLGVDTLLRKLPLRGKQLCIIIADLLMLFACGLLLVGSWRQTLINLGTASPVTGISVAWLYATGLVASLGMGAYLLRNLFRLLTGRAGVRDLVLSSETSDDENPSQVSAELGRPLLQTAKSA